MMTARERVAQLERKLRRAQVAVEVFKPRPGVEVVTQSQLGEWETAQEELAAAETLLLLALEREALFSKVESASKIMTNATAETPAQGPRKRIKSVDKS